MQRLNRIPRHIITDKPEEEIWTYLNKITSFAYAKNILEFRKENNFFGLFLDEINNAEQDYMTNQGLRIWNNINSFLKKKDIYNNANEITILIK